LKPGPLAFDGARGLALGMDQTRGAAESTGSELMVAYIALGSNLGDREATLESAVRQIGSLPGTRLLARSSWIQTDPVGVEEQPAFLNGAVEIETSLAPRRLLEGLLTIEAAHGRRREEGSRWGPRTLDLDLLLYGTRVIQEGGLRVPHPRLVERAFVLVPLSEIAGHALIPTLGLTVDEALERLGRSGT
jgi:2-amino-4-hydroxy-6-hydroxymethyldihydropteridine diphosphokinase